MIEVDCQIINVLYSLRTRIIGLRRDITSAIYLAGAPSGRRSALHCAKTGIRIEN